MTNRRALIVLISAAAVVGIGMGIRQANGLFLYPITADLSVGREVFGFAIALGLIAAALHWPIADEPVARLRMAEG